MNSLELYNKFKDLGIQVQRGMSKEDLFTVRKFFDDHIEDLERAIDSEGKDYPRSQTAPVTRRLSSSGITDDPALVLLHELSTAMIIGKATSPQTGTAWPTGEYVNAMKFKRALRTLDKLDDYSDFTDHFGYPAQYQTVPRTHPEVFKEYLKRMLPELGKFKGNIPDLSALSLENAGPFNENSQDYIRFLNTLDELASEGSPIPASVYDDLFDGAQRNSSPLVMERAVSFLLKHGPDYTEKTDNPNRMDTINAVRSAYNVLKKIHNRDEVPTKDIIDYLKPFGSEYHTPKFIGSDEDVNDIERYTDLIHRSLMSRRPDAIRHMLQTENGANFLNYDPGDAAFKNAVRMDALKYVSDLDDSEREKLPMEAVSRFINPVVHSFSTTTPIRFVSDMIRKESKSKYPLFSPKLVQTAVLSTDLTNDTFGKDADLQNAIQEYAQNYKKQGYDRLYHKMTTDPLFSIDNDNMRLMRVLSEEDQSRNFPSSLPSTMANTIQRLLSTGFDKDKANMLSKALEDHIYKHVSQPTAQPPYEHGSVIDMAQYLNGSNADPVNKALNNLVLRSVLDKNLHAFANLSPVSKDQDLMDKINEGNHNQIFQNLKEMDLSEDDATNKNLSKAKKRIYNAIAYINKAFFGKRTIDAPKVSAEPDRSLEGVHKELLVRPQTSGLRALRTLAENALKPLSIKNLNNKLNPFRKTVENTRMVDDWDPITTKDPASGWSSTESTDDRHLDLNKLQAYKEYAATTPQARSLVPKIDRLINHVITTGETNVRNLPPELKSSPSKKKESTSQVMIDWDPISTGGSLDLKKINQRIDEAPEMPVNYFHGKYTAHWQKHNESDPTQNLLSLSLHPKQIEQLKNEGLYEDFQKIIRSNPYLDSHPQDRMDGIGWVRWTSAPSRTADGWSATQADHHIDEVQSDFDDCLKKYKRGEAVGQALYDSPELDESELNKKAARIREIAFHGLEPADFLHEAWQQHMRNNGRVGDKYSVWSHKSRSKMTITGLNPDRQPPVDWHIAYNEKPQKMGAEPSTYSVENNESNRSQKHKGEPVWSGKIHKTERMFKNEGDPANLISAFHNADDAAIEKGFHTNPNRKVMEDTIDELLSSPEGKASLAAYIQRAANEHHGISVMKELIKHNGNYWLRAIEDPYRRLTSSDLIPHVGKHFMANIAHENHVEGANDFIEHLLAHATPDHREEMVRPLQGAPIVRNLALVGTLANTVYKNDPAQLFADIKVDPDIVAKLPFNAQMGYAVHAMEVDPQQAHKGKYTNAKVVIEDLIRKGGRDFAKKLTDYAKFRGVDPETNILYRDVVDSNSALKPFSGTQLSVKSGSAALRKLRDYLKENGDKLPDELPSGQRWNTITKPIVGRGGAVQYVLDWNPLRNKAGKLNADVVQGYIDSIPSVTYDFEVGDYQDPKPAFSMEQLRSMLDADTIKRMFNTKHSKGPQKVLRLKLSNHDMDKLRSTGADKTLATLIDLGKNSGHPVSPNTVGWIRFTQGNDGHVMVDEAQSDLEANYEAVLKQQYEKMYPDASPEQIQDSLNQFMSKLPPAHIEQIKEVAFRGKPASEVLHEALHQYGRHHGWSGSKWQGHSSKSKAPISLDMSKPMPAHFKENYDNVPKALGAVPAKYGELDTQKNPAHDHLPNAPTWQDEFRKKER